MRYKSTDKKTDRFTQRVTSLYNGSDIKLGFKSPYILELREVCIEKEQNMD